MAAPSRRLERLAGHLLQQQSTSEKLSSSSPSSLVGIVRRADSLEETQQHQQVVDMLTHFNSVVASASSINGEQRCEVSWRLARAHERLWQDAVSSNDISQQDYHFQQGLTRSKEATLQNERSGFAHKWSAIYLGMETEVGGVLASARNAQEIDSHLRSALELLPEDATLHFMRV